MTPQTPAATPTVRCELQQRVLVVTLDRPEQLNAFNGPMMQALVAAFDRADADDEVRAVVVTGAGRAFCAGADLSSGGQTFDYAARRDRPDAKAAAVSADGSVDWSNPAIRDRGGMLTLRIFNCLKPVIAAVNGAAVGIGATMLLPMDVRLATEGARFGFVFARRGITPEACSSWFLPRIVGISRALEWTMSGRLFPASEAKEGGLVREVLPPGALMDAAMALAREVAENTAPVSVALTRQMMWRMLGESHPMMAHRVDSRAIFSRGASADAKEGVGSFLEKRPANFTLRVSDAMPPWFPWWQEPGYE